MNDETIESICQWADETFGVCTLDAARNRVRSEYQEFHEAVSTKDIIEEAADVWITLARIPGLQEAVNAKMRVNRSRRWRSNGDGTGQHIKDYDERESNP